MSNQPAIDSLNIKIGTVEANIRYWENKSLDALATGSMVDGRRAVKEAAALREELFELRHELRKLELGQ